MAEDNPWIVDSRTKVAAHFGVATATVGEWIVRGCPRKNARSYDLVEITRWYVQQNKKSTSSELRDRKLLADIEAKEQEVAKRRLELQVQSEQLVTKDSIAHELVAWALKIRTGLTPLGDQIAALVPGSMKATVKHSVVERVRLTLLEAYTTAIAGQSVEEHILEMAPVIAKRRGSGRPKKRAVKKKRGRGRPRKNT